jgi:hypothetical protein
MKKSEDRYGPVFTFPDGKIAQGRLGTGTALLNSGSFKPGKVLYEFDDITKELMDTLNRAQQNEINKAEFERRKHPE